MSIMKDWLARLPRGPKLPTTGAHRRYGDGHDSDRILAAASKRGRRQERNLAAKQNGAFK